MPDEVLELLSRELDLERGRVYAMRGPARPRRAVVAARARPARAEGRAVARRSRAPASRADDEAAPTSSPCFARRRRPRAPPVRLVRDLGRGVHRGRPPTDPDVLAIKQTLYRTSGDSPIVAALDPGRRARQAGRRARRAQGALRRGGQHRRGPGRWSRRACTSSTALVGLKTHAKICLVVRARGRRHPPLRHVGTGNYNPKTAALYEDLGLLTADQALGADVTELFNLPHRLQPRSARTGKLLVAPLDAARRGSSS